MTRHPGKLHVAIRLPQVCSSLWVSLKGEPGPARVVGRPYGSPFLPIPVPRKNSKSLKKSLYPFFVELGRRAWVWEAYLRGVVSFSSRIYYCIVVRTSPLMRSGVDHTVLTANTPHLHLPVIHVPNYMDLWVYGP